MANIKVMIEERMEKMTELQAGSKMTKVSSRRFFESLFFLPLLNVASLH